MREEGNDHPITSSRHRMRLNQHLDFKFLRIRVEGSWL